MFLDPDACFNAVRARDRRFDGRFFVAVATTRIYCRPICPVRPPKRENMRFYGSAAAAEGAGFRPCLRCRPERAPGLATVDAVGRLVGAAMAGIEEHALSNARVGDLAASLGVSDRHLRRITEAELGVSPIELAQTQRLLLAKRLLCETSMSQTEIAFASGFGSVRRFNALFKSRYGLNPRTLRGRNLARVHEAGTARAGAKQSGAARTGGRRPGVERPYVGPAKVGRQGARPAEAGQPGVRLAGLGQPGVSAIGVRRAGAGRPALCAARVGRPGAGRAGARRPSIGLAGADQAGAGQADAGLTCQLDFRPPLAWESLLSYLRLRAIPGVESVDATHYRRTVRIHDHQGWIAISLAKSGMALNLDMSQSLAPIIGAVIGRVKNLFDLSAVPDAVSTLLSQDALLRPVVQHLPGLRVPGAFDGFELGVRAILGQQVSVRAATTIAGRYARTFGAEIVTPYPALNRLTPTVQRMAEVSGDEIAATGVVGSRARSIAALARAVGERRVTLAYAADVDSQVDGLLRLPGIGPWTAQYIAMRALHWPDAFPGTDLMLLRAAQATPKRLQARAEGWRPWRAYATHYLWQSLGVFP